MDRLYLFVVLAASLAIAYCTPPMSYYGGFGEGMGGMGDGGMMGGMGGMDYGGMGGMGGMMYGGMGGMGGMGGFGGFGYYRCRCRSFCRSWEKYVGKCWWCRWKWCRMMCCRRW